jgi:hypothetical protein
MVVIVVVVVIAAFWHDDTTAQCTPESDSQQHQRENSFHDVAFPFRCDRTLLSGWITGVFVCNRTCRFIRVLAAHVTRYRDALQRCNESFR